MINNIILTERNGSTATIWLNRPEKQNALNFGLLSDLLMTLKYFNANDSIRVIVIRGKGKSFCAGADLNWMLQSSLLSDSENYSECETLAKCFFEIHHSPKITISLVHGACMGGGNGLVSSCDLAIADETSSFAFSEVRLGLLPATVAPYVIMKIGRSKAIELMLTGRKFSAEEALQWGLVNHVSASDLVDQYIGELIKDMNKGEPHVQSLIKTKLFKTGELSPDETVINETAALLAQTRIRREATEGINAFMQKRKPSWDNELT